MHLQPARPSLQAYYVVVLLRASHHAILKHEHNKSSEPEPPLQAELGEVGSMLTTKRHQLDTVATLLLAQQRVRAIVLITL